MALDAEDLGSEFVMLPLPLLARLDGDLLAAAIVMWVKYKAQYLAEEGRAHHDGHVWLTLPQTALAEKLSQSKDKVQRAVKRLVADGILVTEKLRAGGAYDQTLSYRLNVDTSQVDDADARHGDGGVATLGEKRVIDDAHVRHEDDAPMRHLPLTRESEEVPPYSPPPASLSADADDTDSDALPGLASTPAAVDLDASFAEFYAAYPRHVGRGAAKVAYRAAINGKRATVGELQSAAEAFARRRRGKDPKFTPHPATWLRQDRWLDDEKDSPGARVADGNADYWDNGGTFWAGGA